MFHLKPRPRTSLAVTKLLHVYNGLLPNYAPMKSDSRKYLVLSTLCARDSKFWVSRHPFFASNTKMKALRSLKPIPSSAFGLHIFAQAIQANFLFLSRCPHQKLLIAQGIQELETIHCICWGSLGNYFYEDFAASRSQQLSFPTYNFLANLIQDTVECFFLPLPHQRGQS